MTSKYFHNSSNGMNSIFGTNFVFNPDIQRVEFNWQIFFNDQMKTEYNHYKRYVDTYI